MDYFELLRHRKSIRKFKDEPVSKDDLEKVLLAAAGAPVGSNLYRDIHLTAVQSRDVLEQLSRAAVKRWEDKAEMRRIEGDTPPSELRRRVYDPFYGAPAVIFVSHRRQEVQPGIEYSNVAIITYGMHLAAADLGLGSVFMWFALESMRMLPELDNTAVLGLPEGFQPLMGLAVGHPAREPGARDVAADRIAIDYL